MKLRRARRRFRLVVASLVAVIVSVALAAPVGAHTGKGVIVVVDATPTPPLTVRYEVAITFSGDGHPAPDAVASVVAESGDGGRVGPVPLSAVTARKGNYEATVSFPAAGTWQVRFSSLEPTAILERTESITQPPGTPGDDVTASTSNATAAASTAAGLSATSGAATTEVPSSTTPPRTPLAHRRERRWAFAWALIGGTGVILGGGVARELARRRRRNA